MNSRSRELFKIGKYVFYIYLHFVLYQYLYGSQYIRYPYVCLVYSLLLLHYSIFIFNYFSLFHTAILYENNRCHQGILFPPLDDDVDDDLVAVYLVCRSIGTGVALYSGDKFANHKRRFGRVFTRWCDRHLVSASVLPCRQAQVQQIGQDQQNISRQQEVEVKVPLQGLSSPSKQSYSQTNDTLRSRNDQDSSIAIGTECLGDFSWTWSQRVSASVLVVDVSGCKFEFIVDEKEKEGDNNDNNEN